MDYIVGRGGLACEFGNIEHKFLEIGTDSDTIRDCRVFNNRYQAYDDGEEYMPTPTRYFCLELEAKK